MTNDAQNKSGQQNQPTTQKLNDQQQQQGAQQAPKPETATAPQAAGAKSPATETAKN